MTGPPSPDVAVVIPCFNQAHFLREAIESAFSQSHPPREVIVVDDSSDDNSFEVAGRVPEARRFRIPHGGVAAARNFGLGKASSDLVVFLDADDRLLPRALEVGAKALADRPQVAAVVGMSRDIGSDGEVLRQGGQPLVTQDHYLRLLQDCFIWSGSSVVYRRSAIEALEGFDASLTAADDYDLYLRLARRFPLYCHEAVVTEYRRHGTNTTRNAGIVLASQLDVLARQQARLRDGRERQARRRGIRKTRREHGRALAEQVAEDWRRRQRRQALRGLGTLLRRDPRGLTHLLGAS
jgi:cellulose synthase/poly-beta-1,6-N-acetylglucosamine synthase-like glycosyltransferase